MQREVSIDLFRGMIVILFLFLNFLFSFSPENTIPFILRHNQPNALLPGDFIAALFAFVMGAALSLSYERRVRNNESHSIILMTYARRFVMLIVIGVILDSLWALGELKFQWGVLQTLGLAGMVSILLLQFTNRKKIIIAISVLVVYGLLLLQNQIFYEYINSTRHGGPLGALSYSVIMIFGFVSSSMLILEQKPYREMIVIGIAIILLSLLCSLVIPYNKLLVTPSYALITAGAGIVLLVALRYFCEKYNITSGPLLLFGRNSLLAWVLQYPLVYYPLMLFEVWTPFGFFEGIMLAFWFVFITYFLVKLAEGHNISLRM